MYIQAPFSTTDLAVAGFDWDDGNRNKCQKHGVAIVDIEAMFLRPIALVPHPDHSHEEERFKAIGTNDEGRGLFVVFTLRKRGRETLVRPISARYITEKRSRTMKKKLPKLTSDEEAEDFVATANLTNYDLSEMKVVQFEFKPKTERVNMRLSKDLLDSVRARAEKEGMSYQRFIRQALERAGTQRRS